MDTVTGNVLLSSESRVLTSLNSILLSRKTECVISHRMKHIETAKTLVAAEDITGDISKRMTYMQSCS